jgi:hypothetical protein
MAELIPTAVEVAKTYWIVPAGMIALHYYGRFHFNTPDYALEQKLANGQPSVERWGLSSLAPPIFTTYRARYNRYARRYILILEAAFLAIVFLTGLVNIGADITKLSLPNLAGQNLQYRALWALFALTGLLSSFPVFKDIDGWLLKRLHESALIPDDARLTAQRLYDAAFETSEDAADAVRKELRMRDTIRVAEKKANGSLELRLLQVLWLRVQLQKAITADKFARFRLKLERDIYDVFNMSKGLREDVRSYFKDQERLIDGNVKELDNYIVDNQNEDEFAELGRRREVLQGKCDALYFRLCLLTALMVFATAFSAERANEAFERIGFKVKVSRRPIMDWNTIFLIGATVFVVILSFNVAFAVLFMWLDLHIPNVSDRTQLFQRSVIETAQYVIVIVLALHLKKYFSFERMIGLSRQETLVVACSGYVASAVVYCGVQYFMRGYVNLAPFLLALNYGVLAYFIAIYTDRIVHKQDRTDRLVLLQSSCQFLATMIGIGLIPLPPDVPLTTVQTVWVAMLGACEAAVVGMIIGIMFQRMYRPSIGGPSAAGNEAAIFGDLLVQPRPYEPQQSASGLRTS